MNVKLLNLRRIVLLPLRNSLRWALLITMVLTLSRPIPVHAAGLVVNTLDDQLKNSDGACSLREAIKAANNNLRVDGCPAGSATSLDTISFAVSGTINLVAQLEVTGGGPLLIDGGNAIEVSGVGVVRVMFVNSDAVVRLEDLAISNGSAGEGAGIYTAGTLALDHVVVSGNHASGYGGGISNYGTLNVTGSTLSANFANQDGGGIDNSGTLTISDSTLSGNQSHAFGGGISNYGTATMTNSTLTASNAYRFGGGIVNSGMMTISGSTVSNNGADFGVGGIFNWGTLYISNSSMQDNYAFGECGGSFNSGTLTVADNSSLSGSGICNVGTLAVSDSTLSGSGIFNAEWTEILGIMFLGGDGIVTITDSTLTGSHISNVGTLNVTGSTLSGSLGSQGGAIYNAETVELGFSSGAGILTLTDSTLSGNHANQGGGIFNLGTLDVTASILSGNTAYHEGGGIYNAQRVDGGIESGPGILTLTNSTLSNNSASQSGGIHNSGTLTVRNSTLSGNHIEQYDIGWDGRGGNITNDAGTVTLSSSILAYTPSGVNCDGAIIDAGYNIEDADTCNLVPDNGSLPNTDPLLGPLTDNGGPTLTHALLPGSPVIDAGDPLNCPATDQRGVSRPLDGNNDGIAACDIGAYEAGIAATVDIIPNVIRLPSKGQWITAYIELPNGFTVAAIDLRTLRLQGTIPAANQVAKVADHDKDGKPDITVQFSQHALITQLGGVTGEVALHVTGRLRDGTPFEGWDTIFVSQKK